MKKYLVFGKAVDFSSQDNTLVGLYASVNVKYSLGSYLQVLKSFDKRQLLANKASPSTGSMEPEGVAPTVAQTNN